MRSFSHHRRALTWVGSVVATIAIASAGATAVLAEGPACVVDGTPVTAEQLAADPTLCPKPADPAPVDPAPVDPAPVDPAPVDPAPVNPAPVDPEPVDPAPVDPAPVDPAPTEPAPVDPAPTEPAPVAPAPADPAPPTETQPTGVDPAPTTPTRPLRDARPKPAAPTAVAPVTPVTPVTAAPQDPAIRRTHALIRAKQFQAAPFRDARLFREQFTPKGRIPKQPQMSQADADLLVDAARGTGTSWSTLAAVAWLESRWDDPIAGGIVGRRLSPGAWKSYGVDGNDDGQVERGNRADQARTVAKFLATAHRNDDAALRAYFTNARRARMAARASLLADYFDALGPYALVHGIDDPKSRERLQDRTLADKRIELYDGGRSDVAAGIIDPRALVTLRFLANRFNTVTVSSMVSGHGVYTTSGNVSLHAYGQAVDVAALDGESILGHQQRKSKTWKAVRGVLLLPDAMQPAELISLWDMGGASFALSDHHDHIHLGWKTEADS